MTFEIPYTAFKARPHAFTRIFLEYAMHSPPAEWLWQTCFEGDYRNYTLQAKKLERLSCAAYPRKELVKILLRQNRAFGCSEKTLLQIQKFERPNAVAVVTGQQVGMLTGNLYTIYKTLSAIAFARQMQQTFPDYEFIPVFWLEGEDHDYAEVCKLSIFSDNRLHTFSYQEAHLPERYMTGRIVLSSEIAHFITEVLTMLPSSEFKAEIADLVRTTYREGETLLSAFAKLMHLLFKDDGLVFISSDDNDYKRLCKSLFVKELLTAPQSSANVIAQSALLEEHSYEVQAKAKPVNLYFVDNSQRWRIEPQQKEQYLLQPLRYAISRSELLELAEESPERFSPNVILRPLVQDTVLPTFAYIAGPAEVAYFAQLKPNYAFFGLEMPLIVPRHSLSLVEPKIKKVFNKIRDLTEISQLDVSEIYKRFFEDPTHLFQQAIDSLEAVRVEELFARADKDVGQALQNLMVGLSAIDPTLKDALETARGKILYQLGHLKEKAYRAERQKHQDLLAQFSKCETHLLPNRILQERVVNVFYYLCKFGTAALSLIRKAVESHFPQAHLVIEL
ncbi:MAG: bacillithiol biosynthesis cysteine-adding enzyme BshC [Chloroherpetonaceae bacterium]|nr:bacillithiol biosynthesis cysteine-adding enzyme BshC [Chloroherpetonaceae bacterium]MCS7211305.1 bacillithiol biosynthesis cysteine-adding enzyme BshC [Chloroherpetonaceae bacterium]